MRYLDTSLSGMPAVLWWSLLDTSCTSCTTPVRAIVYVPLLHKKQEQESYSSTTAVDMYGRKWMRVFLYYCFSLPQLLYFYFPAKSQPGLLFLVGATY